MVVTDIKKNTDESDCKFWVSINGEDKSNMLEYNASSGTNSIYHLFAPPIVHSLFLSIILGWNATLVGRLATLNQLFHIKFLRGISWRFQPILAAFCGRFRRMGRLLTDLIHGPSRRHVVAQSCERKGFRNDRWSMWDYSQRKDTCRRGCLSRFWDAFEIDVIRWRMEIGSEKGIGENRN